MRYFCGMGFQCAKLLRAALRERVRGRSFCFEGRKEAKSMVECEVVIVDLEVGVRADTPVRSIVVKSYALLPLWLFWFLSPR